jgi:F-type H+-transporting ATPase subunit gamma
MLVRALSIDAEINSYMAGTKEIKRRIKSVKNTKKITKAMELVSASKMKRAIASTLSARPYSGYSWEVLQSLSAHAVESANPLLAERAGNKTLVIFITSNRGLCGAYNAQVTKKVLTLLRSHRTVLGESPQDRPVEKMDFISVGKKGEGFLRRAKQEVVASFNDVSDNPKLLDVYPIASLAIDLYKQGTYDRVLVAYTDFVSALTQVPEIKQLLPVKKEEIAAEISEAQSALPKGTKQIDYTFEPDYETLMSMIIEKIARVRVFQMMLESAASEHSARMLAMKNASDAAGEMIDDLTLAFNKARQAGITQEISEISAGMASVS